MGDRFYQQQLETLGTCPGSKSTTKRKRKVAWDDDKKAAVVAAYEEASHVPFQYKFRPYAQHNEGNAQGNKNDDSKYNTIIPHFIIGCAMISEQNDQ